MEYVLQTNALGKSYGHFKALNGLLYCRPPGFTVVPPGKYLAGGLQSDCTANLTGVQYKIHLLRKSALEIERAFSERLTTDTNTLIAISSRDSTMRSLAAAINTQLRRLRTQRRRFQQGDMELKNAVTNISHDLRTPLTAIFHLLQQRFRIGRSSDRPAF